MDPLDFLIEAQERGLIGALAIVGKGYCPHCGKKIARGVWMHTQHCKAKP